jgi:hypothetical protein
MNTFASRTLATLALLAALALPTAFANGPVHVDAGAAPFDEGTSTLGIDLAWNGDLVIVLATKGIGALGNAVVPVVDVDGLPTDALGRVRTDEAITRSGVVVATPAGASFVLDGGDVRAAATGFAERLQVLGFDADVAIDGRHVTFERDGRAFRAAFALGYAGVAVHVSEL